MTERDQKILIVDDDVKLNGLIAEYLSPHGFEIDSETNGVDGLEAILSGKFDAVILDIMMPGMSGIEVLKEVRKSSNIPILLLTALGDEADRIVGLELGADDYLPKTFSSRELLARLRSVLRRSEVTKEIVAVEEIKVRDLVVDPRTRSVEFQGVRMELTPIEFDLLHCLASSPDRVLTRDFLLDNIAGRDFEVFDRSVDVHISSLRKKLGDDPKNPGYIRTVRSAGYMFVDEFEAGS